MKLCTVSPKCANSKDPRHQPIASAQHILSFLATCRHDFVLLPGVCDNTPAPEDIQRVLAPGVHVFVEHPEKSANKKLAQPYVVSKNSLFRLPKQQFAQNPSQKQVLTLAGC